MRRVMTDMHLPEITIAYGLTEASPGITMTPRDSSVAQRSQTVGVVLPEARGQDRRSRRPAATARPASAASCAARGYNVMKGYYNNPEATRAAIDADGWLHTGDEASVDADGCFRITGRIKDIIIRGGENIAPKEIEDRPARAPGGRRRVRLRRGGCVFRRSGGRGGPVEAAESGGGAGEEHDRLVREQPREIQGAALRPLRAGVSDDRVRKDSEVQAARGAREQLNSET